MSYIDDASIEFLKKQENDLNDFKKALDQSSIVAITDKEGTIIYANDAFCKISKYSREELIGQNHRILKSGYHPDSFYTNLWEMITDGRIWHGDIKNKAKDGSFYWVKTTITPFLGKDGKPERYIAIRTDITSQKKTEYKFNKLQEELLSIVKHEFKTPLMPIKGYCEILQEQSNENLTKDQQHALNRIYQNINKFEHVIDNILDIYSLETNLLFFNEEVFSVHDFMTDVASDFSKKITQSGMEFINTNIDEAEIKGDAPKLKQVFEHIINNAKSFSLPETGKIEIGAKVDEEMVTFYVKNNGSVIPKEEQQNIFKKFYQIDSSKTRRHQGMGLGLAICKEIIEKLDGKIWCESEEGKETTFYFSIPIYKEKITMESSH